MMQTSDRDSHTNNAPAHDELDVQSKSVFSTLQDLLNLTNQ